MPFKELSNNERTAFLSRDKYLHFLSGNVSQNRHSLILAPFGFGKTSLIRAFLGSQKKEFSKGRPSKETLKEARRSQVQVYFDLSSASISPESFAVEFMGNVMHSLLDAKMEDFLKFQDIDFLGKLKMGANAKVLLGAVKNELEKIKPNQVLLLDSAFEFAHQVALDSRSEMLVVFDDAEELFGFDNYPQIRDFIALFTDITKRSSHVTYIFASSKVNLCKKRFGDVVETMVIEGLGFEETRAVVEKSVGRIDERVASQIHSLCCGIPMVTASFAESLKTALEKDSHLSLRSVESIAAVKEIFVRELADDRSAISRYAAREVSTALSDARGASLLKNIVRVLALGDHLRLTDVAKRIYRSGPVTKSLLDRLTEVDLVVKDGSFFRLKNDVVRSYCRLWFAGLKLSHDSSKDDVDEVSRILL